MIVYQEISTDVIHETSVDYVLRPSGKVINLVQYDDTLPKLKVKLLKNNKEFTIPEDTEFLIRYSKPDGTFVYNSAIGCSQDRTCVYFAITFQMTTDIGKLFAVIEILHGEERAASSPIQININHNPIQSDDIESHVELGIVESLLHQSEIAVLEAQLARDRCEQIYTEILDIVGGGYVTLATQQHITGEKTIDRINVNQLITFNQNGRFTGDFIPNSNGVYDIGNSAYKINIIYGNKLVLGRYELDERKLGKLLELLEAFVVEEDT